MNTSQLPKPDFLDILFNSRNKDYGAYDLRRKYDRRVRNAVAGMAGIVLLCVAGYLWSANSKAAEVVEKPVIFTPDMIEAPPPEERITPPPPVHDIEPPARVASVQHVTPRIIEDDKVNPDEELKAMDDLKKEVAIGTQTVDGEPGEFENPFEGSGTGHSVIEPPKEEKPEAPLTFVEINPEFPGGPEALNKWLGNQMRYPALAAENGIEGTVFARFVVSADGSISNVEINGANRLGGGCEEEAIRVIRKMPKWKPGRQNGRNVAVWFNLPIRFTLNQ